jgi:hypothetical protein
MDQLDDLLENEKLEFFEILRENFRDKVVFDLNHPLESIFLYNALQESNHEETGTVVKDMINGVMKFVAELVRKYQGKGELNPSVSPELASFFIFQSQLGIYEYLSAYKGINFRECIKSGHLFSVSETEIMNIVDEIIVVLKSGLKV